MSGGFPFIFVDISSLPPGQYVYAACGHAGKSVERASQSEGGLRMKKALYTVGYMLVVTVVFTTLVSVLHVATAERVALNEKLGEHRKILAVLRLTDDSQLSADEVDELFRLRVRSFKWQPSGTLSTSPQTSSTTMRHGSKKAPRLPGRPCSSAAAVQSPMISVWLMASVVPLVFELPDLKLVIVCTPVVCTLLQFIALQTLVGLTSAIVSVAVSFGLIYTIGALPLAMSG